MLSFRENADIETVFAYLKNERAIASPEFLTLRN